VGHKIHPTSPGEPHITPPGPNSEISALPVKRSGGQVAHARHTSLLKEAYLPFKSLTFI